MITLTEINDIIKMEIKLHIPQTEIFEFLQKRGYEVKAFSIDHPECDGFLIYEPASTEMTFTATKGNEEQCRENLYLTVFHKEMKETLKLS